MIRAFSKTRLKGKSCLHVKRSKSTNFTVGIVGAPLSKGQTKCGVEHGPEAIRKRGLVAELAKIGVNIEDVGDLNFQEISSDVPFDKVKHPLSVGSACQKISQAVRTVLESNKKCLTLGGDHSIGIGTVHGHAQVYNELCLLWVDAHADINTEITTQSGNIHGMSCSFLIKELQKYRNRRCPGFEWMSPSVNKHCVAYIGLRDVDPLEKLILTKENIVHFTMKDVDQLGIKEVTKRAIEAINPARRKFGGFMKTGRQFHMGTDENSGKRSLHVSFDIDSIDMSIVPSTGTPVLGGLTLREALNLAEEVSKTGTINAVDLVEVNPKIGNKDQVDNTVDTAVLVIKTLFGYSRDGHLPEDISVVPVG